MSTKLKAGTSTSGAVLDADTTGILELQTGSTPTTAINIDAAQNVQLGSTTPASTGIPVTVAKAYNASTAPIGSAIALQRTDGSDVLGSIGFYTSNGTKRYAIETNVTVGNGMEFNYGASNKMYLDTSGNLGVGASSTGPKLYVNQATTSQYAGYFNFVSGGYGIGIKNASGGAATLAYFFSTNYVGEISTSGSTTSYTSASDYRLKDNIAPMTGALAKVSALKPVTYKWKADGSDGQGFIAHELAEICPDAVIGKKDEVNEDGTIKAQSVDTSFLVATLVSAIQELKAEVDALKGAK